MLTDGLIDARNINLWNLLKETNDIVIIRESRSDYMVETGNGKCLIHVNMDYLDPSSFAHELLHIDININGGSVTGGLKRNIMCSDSVAPILSENLLDHIGNCLEHFKMLPKFLSLGYNQDEFIQDSSTDKLTEEDIEVIKHFYVSYTANQKYYNAEIVDGYIGKYFAASSCTSTNCNCKLRLPMLKEIDPALYSILQSFLDEWSIFNYEIDEFGLSYRPLIVAFISNLETWAFGKVFINYPANLLQNSP